VTTASVRTSATSAWLDPDDCRLDDFVAIVEQPVDLADYPSADRVEQGALVYTGDRLRTAAADDQSRRDVQAELVRALTDGPGLVVFSGAYADTTVVDRATEAFAAMIVEQRASGATAGDHFARPGANDRVWNALEKLAVREPGVFADYYANEVLALVSEAWLGPGYQVTSQVNVVNPGGEAQSPHRDYHLGFMTDEQASRFPAHVHRLSPVLTLQGAVAHSDMPVESGPTMYLPHSHKYEPGYLAWRRPEFIAYFDEHLVQLPLSKGDAAFFNPALFHCAGHNRSADIRRMANLLQVSSAFGRAMETVDRTRMARALFPVLLERKAAGVAPAVLARAVAACAEGYPFPTNLDLDQPVDGLAPPTQAEILLRAVDERWSPDAVDAELAAYAQRRRS
jgi:ectoine hydroxylase-related dioxygenase (phytanoyl-CoA dioxygenase family)